MAKSSEPTETLRKGKLPPAVAVTNPTEEKGKALECGAKQDGGNANGKHRTKALWGVNSTTASNK